MIWSNLTFVKKHIHVLWPAAAPAALPAAPPPAVAMQANEDDEEDDGEDPEGEGADDAGAAPPL